MAAVEEKWWKDRSLVNIIAGIVAIGMLTLAAIIVITILFVPIPSENETLAGQALGTVLSLLGVVVAFFFSSTSNNRKDSDTIATQADTIKKAQEALAPLNPAADVKVGMGETVRVEGAESK